MNSQGMRLDVRFVLTSVGTIRTLVWFLLGVDTQVYFQTVVSCEVFATHWTHEATGPFTGTDNWRTHNSGHL